MNEQEIRTWVTDPFNAMKLQKMTNSQIHDLFIGKEYVYMTTFTLDPQKNTFTEDFYDKAQLYIEKVLLNIPEITKLYIVREGSDSDHKHTHFHTSITSSRFIKANEFKYYRNKYGQIDHDKTKTKDNSHTIEYMSKQNTPKKLR